MIGAGGAGLDAARVGERVWGYEATQGRFLFAAAPWSVATAQKAVRLPDGSGFDAGAYVRNP